MNRDIEEQTIFNVVMNHEGQYSIWPTFKLIPIGWSSVGKKGTKAECLTYIKEVWTDITPLTVRKGFSESRSSD